MKDTIELFEEFDNDGVCIKRTANGIELPTDIEPSMYIDLEKISSVSQKFFMTKAHFEQRYGKELLTNK
jgi:hypothetical protein